MQTHLYLCWSSCWWWQWWCGGGGDGGVVVVGVMMFWWLWQCWRCFGGCGGGNDGSGKMVWWWWSNLKQRESLFKSPNGCKIWEGISKLITSTSCWSWSYDWRGKVSAWLKSRAWVWGSWQVEVWLASKAVSLSGWLQGGLMEVSQDSCTIFHLAWPCYCCWLRWCLNGGIIHPGLHIILERGFQDSLQISIQGWVGEKVLNVESCTTFHLARPSCSCCSCTPPKCPALQSLHDAPFD